MSQVPRDLSAAVDPDALRRLKVTIAAVCGAMALWAGLVAFVGLWPAEQVIEYTGTDSLRVVFVAWFVAQGLLVLAILVPLAVVVNLLRRRRVSSDRDT